MFNLVWHSNAVDHIGAAYNNWFKTTDISICRFSSEGPFIFGINLESAATVAIALLLVVTRCLL